MAPKDSVKLINTKEVLTKMDKQLFTLGIKYAKNDAKTNSIISEIPVRKLNILSETHSDSEYDDFESSSVSLLYWKIIKDYPEREELSVINVIQTTIFENGYLCIHYNNSLTDKEWDYICDSLPGSTE